MIHDAGTNGGVTRMMVSGLGLTPEPGVRAVAYTLFGE